ncbi:unnamed protein product [Symbiodinium natans]|uniref:Uncharacterized protein n=1 Tax=Symbiodinium natans TaxID=878477 RepID=A0A812Q742_9DINO|nr:unnamed protein product [Symbiodinium natans]
MDAESVGKRLSYLESTVHSVGSLAVHAAEGVGKDRSSRQMVAFFVGQAKERALELLRTWEEGAKASREEGRSPGPGHRPLPFKVQLVRLVGELLKQQGVDGEGEPLQEILGASVVSVEAAFYREPRGESADPWVVTILCKPSLEGLRLRSPLGSEAVRSADHKFD